MFSPMPSSIALLKAGRLKGIAVTSPKRTSLMPEIPTIAEAGVSKYEFQAWYGLLAPAGAPRQILEKLNRDFNIVLQEPAARSAMTEQGAEPLGGSVEEFSRFIVNEVRKYATVAREVGIRAQ
jgi:tripartite-type tricarboxylate transporter receptor subunit TctC